MARTLAQLAEQVGGTIEGDGSVEVRSAATVQSAGPGDISFVANKKYKKYLADTKASALVLDRETEYTGCPVLRHDSPYLTFARIVDILYPVRRRVNAGRHETAVIDESATVDPSAGIGAQVVVGRNSNIGKDAQLMPGVYVGNDATIGAECVLYPGVRIMDGCRIGDRVVLHPGVVIGSDGFGFAPTDTGLKKIQQIGSVEIGNDVEIGANSTIDRGALGPTKIGNGVKIDNLVQIAHNVEIGDHSIIVAQVGISGSTKLGQGVILAGQVGLIGHLEIGDRVTVAAQSGVGHDVAAGKTVFGSPARDISEQMKINAAMPRLPDLLKRVRRIEQKLDESSGD